MNHDLTLAVFDEEYLTPYRRTSLKYVDLSNPDFGPQGVTFVPPEVVLIFLTLSVREI